MTAAASRTTYDGTTAYPSTPGTTTSFSDYLANPLAISIDATGSGSIDVTDWVKNHPGDTWFLTGSPAPAGTTVTTAASASWGSKWHWQNALIVNGNTESPIQLVLDFSLPSDSPPVITTQPPARTAHYAGEPFSLSVAAATGSATLSYQWKKNGSDIPGATSATLDFSPLALADAADYQVTVTNTHGSVTSSVCDLTVIAHPDLANFTVPPGEATRYHAQGNAVVGINQGRYFNRALYINNTNAFVLTGDKPMAKFASGGNQHGKFFVGITRGATTKWLHNCANISAAFQPAHTTWLVTDPSFPGLSVKLEITALTGSVSFAARATATGAQSGDKLVWAYGGSTVPGGTLNTTYDAYRIGEGPLLTESFSPTAATNNVAQIGSGTLAGSFNVVPTSGSTSITFGRCSSGSYLLGNASSWTTPASLVASTASTQPLVCGEISALHHARRHLVVHPSVRAARHLAGLLGTQHRLHQRPAPLRRSLLAPAHRKPRPAPRRIRRHRRRRRGRHLVWQQVRPRRDVMERLLPRLAHHHRRHHVRLARPRENLRRLLPRHPENHLDQHLRRGHGRHGRLSPHQARLELPLLRQGLRGPGPDVL